MHISWLGSTAVKLQTKHNGEDVNIVIDPYKPAEKGGSFPNTLAPQLAVYSQGQNNSIKLQQNPFIVDSPGEHEVYGVIVQTFPTEDGLMIQLNAEGITVLHVGALKGVPSDEILDKLTSIDVLLVPVGGHETLSAKQAAALTTKLIEPRVCIPIAFKYKKGDPKQATVDPFLKEIGNRNGDHEPKIILSASKLPQEEMEVHVLSHQ